MTTTMGQCHRQKSYQSNNQRAWLYLFVYWSVGQWVGLRFGYSDKILLALKQIIPSFPATINKISPALWQLHYGLALLVSLECWRRLMTRFDRFGRKPDVLATLVFAVGNGIYETILYLFCYDCGKKLMVNLHMSERVGIVHGFLLYSIFSGLIHALFWVSHVLPKNTKQDAPEFHKHGLPLLIIMSVAWFAIYEVYDDAAYICLLHVIVDAWSKWQMAFQRPSIGTIWSPTLTS